MALRRKMYHPVNLIFRKNPSDGLPVRNICFYKCIIITSLNFRQILKIPRICQHVYIDNANLIPVFAKHIMDIIRADKTSSSRHQIRSHRILLNQSVLIVYLFQQNLLNSTIFFRCAQASFHTRRHRRGSGFRRLRMHCKMTRPPCSTARTGSTHKPPVRESVKTGSRRATHLAGKGLSLSLSSPFPACILPAPSASPPSGNRLSGASYNYPESNTRAALPMPDSSSRTHRW